MTFARNTHCHDEVSPPLLSLGTLHLLLVQHPECVVELELRELGQQMLVDLVVDSMAWVVSMPVLACPVEKQYSRCQLQLRRRYTRDQFLVRLQVQSSAKATCTDTDIDRPLGARRS